MAELAPELQRAPDWSHETPATKLAGYSRLTAGCLKLFEGRLESCFIEVYEILCLSEISMQ